MVIRWICFCFVLLAPSLLVTTESNETLREIPLLRCAQVNKARPRFHLVRRCARSDLRVVITANFSSVWRCSEFALFKRGLAINFGGMTDGLSRCEVLECPEHDTLASLRRRENYDYYSLYSNPLPSIDWMCVPKVGIFRIGRGEAKSASRRKCQEWALMPTPRQKTKGEKGTNSSTPGDQTGMSTSVAAARSEELQSSNLLSSATPLSRTQPPPDIPPPPSFWVSPQFGNSTFEPPFLPPNDIPGGLEESPLWSPEYQLGELLNTSNAADVKPREAGQLAKVLSQDRTTNLTTFLLSRIGKFFPPVLIGLDTVPGDPNLFATSDGEPLPCFRFRAWAPGHPLPPKRLDDILQQRISISKPSTQVTTNETAKGNTTISYSNSNQETRNETMNGTKIEITSVSQRKRDEMTLCVYLHRDSLWHTNLCSVKTLFLCELLPSGGPCRDANSTDERAECEYEKIGTKEDRCSAWNGEMITTTMMPTEPENNDGNNNGDDNEDDNNSNNDNDGNNNGDDNEDDNNSNNDNDGNNNGDDNEPSEDTDTGYNDDRDNNYDYGSNDEDNNDNNPNDEYDDDTVIRDDNSDSTA